MAGAMARSARELGLPIVMGAPNVMRGESLSGNVSAAALVELGLVDALASDYLPCGLLAGAFTLARKGLAPLPAAIGLVTSGAAAAAGLFDRGRLAADLRADLALVDDTGSWTTRARGRHGLVAGGARHVPRPLSVPAPRRPAPAPAFRADSLAQRDRAGSRAGRLAGRGALPGALPGRVPCRAVPPEPRPHSAAPRWTRWVHWRQQPA